MPKPVFANHKKKKKNTDKPVLLIISKKKSRVYMTYSNKRFSYVF